MGGHEGKYIISIPYIEPREEEEDLREKVTHPPPNAGLGEVVTHGPGVTNPPIGAKVGIKYAAGACLSCANCLQGGETTCTSAADFKLSGFLHPGTFQQYVVSPASYVTPIPAAAFHCPPGGGGVGKDDLAAAAPLMCGGVSVYAALRRAGVKQGDWVVVSGAGGGLGHLAVQYARVLGGRVLGVDAGASKEALVRGLGAEAFFDFTAFASDEDLAAAVRDATGGGAQIVLVCTSSARSYASGMMWLGFRGKLCCLGLPAPESEPALAANILQMVSNELTITGKLSLSSAVHMDGLSVSSLTWHSLRTSFLANKSGNRLEAIEAVDIAARHGIKTQYQLRKMDELTSVCLQDFHSQNLNRS